MRLQIFLALKISKENKKQLRFLLFTFDWISCLQVNKKNTEGFDGSNQSFLRFQHVLTLKKFSESKNKVRNRLCFLLFTFLLITRLKPNEKTLRYENL